MLPIPAEYAPDPTQAEHEEVPPIEAVPGAQPSQTVSEIAAHAVFMALPTPHEAQVMQLDCSTLFWYSSLLQSEHVSLAPKEYRPTMQEEQTPDFFALNFPLTQIEQYSAPSKAKVPAGHSKQLEAPTPA